METETEEYKRLKANGEIIRRLASEPGIDSAIPLVTHLFKSTIITNQEARAALGLPPIAGEGDFIITNDAIWYVGCEEDM